MGNINLKVNNISFSYDTKKKVLNDISFLLNKGEKLVIAGPNGSGKTTLIKLIFDLLQKQEGEIKVLGIDNTEIEAKTKMMYLPSDNILPDFLSGQEYVDLMLKMYDKEKDIGLLNKLVEYYSMTNYMDELIENYSHGMVKKIELISAFLIQPEVLIIDETLNGIDLEAKEVSKILIKKLVSKNKSVIICTHDLLLAEEVGDRAILIHKGNIYCDIDLNCGKNKGKLTEIFKEIIKFKEESYEI
ncbi:MAG: ATP-binding cassette domain-containing protein [Clostridium sp.]